MVFDAMKPTWTPIKVRLGQIKAWDENPRMSTKAQAQRIIKSEREFGQPVPFLLNPMVGDTYPLLDGHQRLSAWLTVYGADYVMDAMVANRELTQDEHKKLVITLHTGATGSWNWDSLSSWSTADLMEWGMDKDALKGWNNDANNLKEMLNAGQEETADTEPQIDRAEELREKWGVSLGQMWQLGEHRLICGDCTDAAVVERVMGGEKAELWMADPPYGINWTGSNASTLEWSEIENDKDTEIVKTIIGLLPNNQDAIFWGANCYPELLPHRGRWICWDKRVTEEADKMIGSPFELAWRNINHGFDIISRVQHGGALNADGGKRFHPTQKPVILYENIIEKIKAAIIYDPFSGSGTTIIACENLGRKCRAVEISPAYVAVALERWANHTGKTPILMD